LSDLDGDFIVRHYRACGTSPDQKVGTLRGYASEGMGMPRHHFHIRTPSGALIQDEEGVHLPDIDAVREETRAAAQSFGKDAERGGYDYSGCYFEIVSQDSRETMAVPAHVRRLAKV
jgi:hypothetical protein